MFSQQLFINSLLLTRYIGWNWETLNPKSWIETKIKVRLLAAWWPFVGTITYKYVGHRRTSQPQWGDVHCGGMKCWNPTSCCPPSHPVCGRPRFVTVGRSPIFLDVRSFFGTSKPSLTSDSACWVAAWPSLQLLIVEWGVVWFSIWFYTYQTLFFLAEDQQTTTAKRLSGRSPPDSVARTHPGPFNMEAWMGDACVFCS